MAIMPEYFCDYGGTCSLGIDDINDVVRRRYTVFDRLDSPPHDVSPDGFLHNAQFPEDLESRKGIHNIRR
jgi:hypothetical protein